MWLILNMGGGGGAAVNMLSCYTRTIIIRYRHKRLILKVGGAAVDTVTNCTHPTYNTGIPYSFRGRKLSRISRFCGYSKSFSCKIWGCGVLWHSTSDQSAKVFSAKIIFFTNSRKFSPSKVIWLYLTIPTLLYEPPSQAWRRWGTWARTYSS